MNEVLKQQRFERLLKPEFDALYRTARRVIGVAALADEAVQDACLKAYASFDLAREPERFRPWMFRILMNQAIDIRRRHLRDVGRSEPADDASLAGLASSELHPLAHLERREMRYALDTAIAALAEDLRAVVVLVLIEEMSYADAAETLDITDDLVRSRLARARLHLRTSLAESSGIPRSSAAASPATPVVSALKRVRP